MEMSPTDFYKSLVPFKQTSFVVKVDLTFCSSWINMQRPLKELKFMKEQVGDSHLVGRIVT